MNARIELAHSISEIEKSQWEALQTEDYPFLRYSFLTALEHSGAVNPDTGWQPLYLKCFENDQLMAIMPLYLKFHSYGEYVFDWAWAEAYERHQLNYYPKLVTAIPFSPVVGPRHIGELSPTLYSGVLHAIKQLCQQHGFSSWHLLFPDPKGLAHWKTAPDVSLRMGLQYHWFNRNYQSFDDYLEHFTARKRKSVKRERRKVAEQGISITTYEGHEITPSLLRSFFRCYQRTYALRGRKGYLNLAFFEALRAEMPENLVLFAAYGPKQQVLATALCFKDNQTLYGRYWGSLEDYDSLHFETCYYTGIDYCIQHGLARFDPGAQGEHKIARGFEPITTWSVHYLQHTGFRNAVAQFVEEEKNALCQHQTTLAELLPFKDNI